MPFANTLASGPALDRYFEIGLEILLWTPIYIPRQAQTLMSHMIRSPRPSPFVYFTYYEAMGMRLYTYF